MFSTRGYNRCVSASLSTIIRLVNSVEKAWIVFLGGLGATVKLRTMSVVRGKAPGKMALVMACRFTGRTALTLAECSECEMHGIEVLGVGE